MSGTCQTATISPRIRVASKGGPSARRRGRARPRQPGSSPSGAKIGITSRSRESKNESRDLGVSKGRVRGAECDVQTAGSKHDRQWNEDGRRIPAPVDAQTDDPTPEFAQSTATVDDGSDGGWCLITSDMAASPFRSALRWRAWPEPVQRSALETSEAQRRRERPSRLPPCNRRG